MKRKYIRRKYYTGGDVAMNSGDYLDIGSGLLSGVGQGAAAGSTIAPGIGTIIGAGIGGLTSLVGGLLGSSSRRKAEAARREAERQRTLGIISNQMKEDAVRSNQFQFSNNTGSYMKFGGKVKNKIPINQYYDIYNNSDINAPRNNPILSDIEREIYQDYVLDSGNKRTNYNDGTTTRYGSMLNQLYLDEKARNPNTSLATSNSTDIINNINNTRKLGVVRTMERLLGINLPITRNQIIEYKYNKILKSRRYATGGLVQNSDNTQIAYGATHNQYNTAQDGTGIDIGGAEVEGGGDYNGRQYAGEVIQNTPNGEKVFSNSIPMVGVSGLTYAKAAQILSTTKGTFEQIANSNINKATSEISNPKLLKTSKERIGTKVRNIEKNVNLANLLYGKAEEQNEKLNDLYNLQESHAKFLGFRNNQNNSYATGGLINAGLLYPNRVNLNTYFPSSNGDIEYEVGTTNYASTRDNIDRNNYNQNAVSTEDIINYSKRAAIGNYIGEFANYFQNVANINNMSSTPIPRRDRIRALYIDPRYNIDNQLQGINRSQQANNKFIKANTSNAQVARANMANISYRTNAAKNQLYDVRNKQEQSIRNANLQRQIDVSNYNNQVDYENAMNNYQKAMEIATMKGQNTRMLLQGMLGAANSVTNLYTQLYGINMSNKMFAGSIGNRLMNN